MKIFSRPEVIVSKCIEFEACRYNGDMIRNEFVKQLMPYVDYTPVCAECEIGLGIPRDPIRVVLVKKEARLVQPSTGLDLTDKMNEFSNGFLGSLKAVDGAILKAYSPSCGIKGVKIYPALEKVSSVDTGAGFFGSAVINKYGLLPVEDELRLTNLNIREHFLTKLFLSAAFRDMAKKREMKALVQFQADNKLLFMTYNQVKMRELGRIVANHEKQKIDKVLENYGKTLLTAFAKIPSFVSNINVLMHAFGYFSKELTSKEKAFVLDSFEKFREKKVPLAVPVSVIRSFIIRFDEKYLAGQTYFEPYPEELVNMNDTGRGK